MLTFDTIAALRAAPPPQGAESALTRGHTTAGDQGGSEFWWDPSSSAADDDGSIVRPAGAAGNGRWVLTARSAIRGEQFGAFGDGAEVGAALVRAAAAVAASPTGRGALELRGGTYLMNGGTISGMHVHLVCTGGPVVLRRAGAWVTAAAPGAAKGATTLPVQPLPSPAAAGTAITFSGGVSATLTANAAAGATVLAVAALRDPVGPGETGRTNGRFLVASGTIGAFTDLLATAQAGGNTLAVPPSFAATLAEGDLLQITSDAPFEPLSTRVQGEMATVREVHGGVVYLTQPLHDTYVHGANPAPRARVAVVDPGSFSVTGRLVIERDRADHVNADTFGIQLAYLDGPHGTLEMRNVQGAGLAVYSCWRPCFHVDAINHARADQDEGQPVLVMNSTMYGRFTGTVAHARHAYASGASGGYYGVPWDNRVTMTATSAGGAIFDCHPQVGSTYFDGCVAISGAIADVAGFVAAPVPAPGGAVVATQPLRRAVPQDTVVTFSGGATATVAAAALVRATALQVSNLSAPVAAGETISASSRGIGFSLGGRYNYVSNARCVGLAGGVGPRGDARTVELIDIDGIVMQDCPGAAFHYNQTPETVVGRVRIRGVRGRVGTAAVNLVRGIIDGGLDAADIHVEGRILHVNPSAFVGIPEELRLANASSRFPTQQPSTVRAIDVRNANVEMIRLHDVHSDAGELLRTSADVNLRLLEATACGGRYAADHYIHLEGGCEVCVVRGGNWEDTQLPDGALVRVAKATPVTYVEVAPARTSGTNLTRAFSTVAGTTVAWYRMEGYMPSVTTELAGVLGGPVQILSGTPQDPAVTRSAGPPAHAARVGSKHLNSAGAPGSQEWIKQTGSGTTGWVPVH